MSTSSPTLQDLKKQKKLTNAQIGAALSCGPGKAGTLLQGRHIHTITINEIRALATCLGVSVNVCIEAMEQSYNQWCLAHEIEPPVFSLLAHLKGLS